jgi:adenylate cyclase
LVCDVVESVRWMQADDVGAVRQWQFFVNAVKSRIIPKFGGRLVKSLGDGLMLDFADGAHAARAALNAAFALHAIADKLSVDGNFCLRIGLNHTKVMLGDGDIYGVGVNLCFRIAAMAGPGEVIITAEMRDQLTDRLDAKLHDLGECYLKHIDQPVRAYRAGPPGAHPVLVPESDYKDPLQATIAVIPFTACSMVHDKQFVLGEIIADGVIGRLSRSPELKVISRLSTRAFSHRLRTNGLDDKPHIGAYLGANYVLYGSYIALDRHLIVTAELSDTRTKQIVWMDRLQGDVGDVLQLQSELCHHIAQATQMAILQTEVQAALTKPLPTLESYSSLLAGISMLYCASKAEFYKSHDLFANLLERHQNSAIVHAWFAHWHVMQAAEGILHKKPAEIAAKALYHSDQALRLGSNSSFAHTTQGLVSSYISNDLDTAVQNYQAAIDLNPNEPLAWLFKGVAHSFRGEGNHAVHDTLKASELSPLDPQRFLFQSMNASANLTAGHYEQAIELSKQAIRANHMHKSAHRCLTIAQVLSGKISDAHVSVKALMVADPSFRVSKYLVHIPSANPTNRKKFAEALLRAGAPG